MKEIEAKTHGNRYHSYTVIYLVLSSCGPDLEGKQNGEEK